MADVIWGHGGIGPGVVQRTETGLLGGDRREGVQKEAG